MHIFPAIDLKDKKVVRLIQGDYNKVNTYSDDAVKIALYFANKGAKYLHVVDLDGAKDGELSNYDVVRQIIQSTSMFVEIGGGIRDLNRINKYMDIGVKRVILGTAAIKNPNFLNVAINTFGQSVAVGVDAKNGMVATDGWLNITDVDSIDFCKNLYKIGVKNVIYTDISKDGLMQGTNMDVYKTLNEIKGLNITASGGITRIDEIEQLSNMGIHSAIVGKAIYEHALSLKEVLKVAGAQ